MKKTNPRRVPCTLADVERARQEGLKQGQDWASVIYLTVLFDKEHATPEIMQRVGNEINELVDSILKGYVTISDLRNTLKQEYGVEI